MQRTAVTEVIRRAEKHIATQEYYLAQALLSEALKMDPGNLYIPAIFERVQILQGMAEDFAELDRGVNGDRNLSVSGGAQRPAGVTPSSMSGGETRLRFQRLLTVIATLCERGSFEAAYESLLKAEKLYPQDPVLSVWREKIIPARESATTRVDVSQPHGRRNDLPGAAASMAAMILSDDKLQDQGARTSEPGFSTFNDRLEVLRRRKEEERVAREQTAGQQSAKQVGEGSQGTSQKSPQDNTPSDSERAKNGFIATLLKRKLFE